VELLQLSGTSITELARRAGMSRASVSEYAHGHRQPGVGQLERLAAAAGLQTEIRFSRDWATRKLLLEDALTLADELDRP
jgi:transcriptional regulator with XRE-family HTH domain